VLVCGARCEARGGAECAVVRKESRAISPSIAAALPDANNIILRYCIYGRNSARLKTRSRAVGSVLRSVELEGGVDRRRDVVTPRYFILTRLITYAHRDGGREGPSHRASTHLRRRG
jgi:hypothetical protein